MNIRKYYYTGTLLLIFTLNSYGKTLNIPATNETAHVKPETIATEKNLEKEFNTQERENTIFSQRSWRKFVCLSIILTQCSSENPSMLLNDACYACDRCLIDAKECDQLNFN